MHAYLIVGNSTEYKVQRVQELAKKLKVKTLEFPLAKIEDTRALRNFTALKVTSPTAIIINSIENATEEAANAFLKNLEEPQENLYYLLTTSNLAAVLPTIVSRCEVIKVQSTEHKVQSYIKPNLTDIEKIKDRGEAKDFVQNLIEVLHFNLIKYDKNHTETAKNLVIAIKTLNNLKSNGNVGLQLTNLVINLI